ncbi:sodium:proton antiporter [Bombilactobacillus folatiphilus]|uniref:Sodium:proton antiporter n=1 Tax=Bombilactobacillus folatiphilus TaxID=2923362 RepID=A0ABY4P917_9LACO|nr:sodium:proton antiporter [Bombilactobacillus folatiphilus]UQS82157.1 sodium:proton antiporter [Bombilactobacillus folatiphilus]
MSLFFTCLLLVGATIVANIIYSIYPKIPLAFYQIIIGFLLSWLPEFTHFNLEPELFFLIVIAPLMFNDGQQTDFRSLRHNFHNVLSLAVILVVLTILIGGGFIHWIWNALPLSLAFALVAIVAPTDAVAVSSITSNVEVPEPIMQNLESESLFNDASGLVALNLALSAFVTGKFSLLGSIGTFLTTFVGGVIVGVLLGLCLVSIQIVFQRHLFDATAITVPFNVLTPFVVYLVAEELNLSGILAAVAAGVVFGIYQRQLRLTSSSNQVVLTSTWEILSNMLNGFVFVLLGVSLPRNLLALADYSNLHFSSLLLLASLIYCLMIGLRLIWIRFKLVKLPLIDVSDRRSSWIVALSGIHGTITLAMAFSLPIMRHGKLIPFRTDLIFMAEIIILLSLIVPTIVLPYLLPGKTNPFSLNEFNDQLVKMVNYAIQELKENDAQNPLVLSRVITILNSQKLDNERTDPKVLRHLLEKTESLELAAINQLVQTDDVDVKLAWHYNRKQLVQMQRIISNPLAKLQLWFKLLKLRWRIYRVKRKKPQLKWSNSQQEKLLRDKTELRKLENVGFQTVMQYLQEVQTADNIPEVNLLRHYYAYRHQRFGKAENDEDQERELIILAFQYEYEFVQKELKKRQLTTELVTALNEKISTDQFVYMTADNA